MPAKTKKLKKKKKITELTKAKNNKSMLREIAFCIPSPWVLQITTNNYFAFSLFFLVHA